MSLINLNFYNKTRDITAQISQLRQQSEEVSGFEELRETEEGWMGGQACKKIHKGLNKQLWESGLGFEQPPGYI